ncbi:MAG: hypothetical protein AAF152_18535 [Cyanobacteria bacterium P01_A01_bin.114]
MLHRSLLLVSALSLATVACSGRQPSFPADLDPLAQQCYREVLKVAEQEIPQVEAPTSMEDGTYLIQWRLSESDFGSCQVDGDGVLMLLTRNQPPTPETTPETAPETTLEGNG